VTAAEAKSRHALLAAEIRRHDHAYYVEGRPFVTDAEYDRLFNELQQLEREFPGLVTPESPSQRVGGAPSEKFARVKHLVPMLSLDKVAASDHPDKDEEPDRDRRNRAQDENTLAELRAFDASLRKQLGRDRIQYIIEPKVDGVSIGVHYRHGKLALGVTRGDGAEGDDITANLKTLRSIPLELRLSHPPALLEVRGEAYMAIRDFDALNAKFATEGEKPFPNARNATAGTLKQLDPKLVAQRPIRAVFYATGACDGVAFKTHSEMLEKLAEYGLPTQNHWWVCDGIDEVLKIYAEKIVAHYDEDKDLRRQLPYEIDGIVLKVNTLADWARIPGRSRAPGYAIVHKPVPWITPAETVLKAITVQVGRTGVLTPVAELEPVFVQGSTIARATLHNEDEIRRKDIRIGDTVVIRKAGMVIPEIFEVVKTKRPPGAEEFDLFAHVGGKCPACGGAIHRDERFIAATCKECRHEIRDPNFDRSFQGEACPNCGTQVIRAAKYADWICDNIALCPAQRVRRIEYFAQRKALDIESLGGIVAEALVNHNLVKEPLDLFDLKLEPLGKLNLGTNDEPRIFGEKNATKILEALQRSKAYPLARWLYAFGIANVGEATAFNIGKCHLDFQDVANSNLLKLISDEGKLRNKSPADDLNEEGSNETLISRKRFLWGLIRQEIDRRSQSVETFRLEVEQERLKLSREIELQTAKQEELEKLVTLHKEKMRERPSGQREKLPEELQKKRNQVKGRLATLEERLNKAGVMEELGPVVAENTLGFFGSKIGKEMLSRLRELEIWPQGGLANSSNKKNRSLAGKTFVLTGSLPTLSRDEATVLIREAGGDVTGSISKNTDYLLAGEEAGSKLKKAKELGIKTLSEKEFLEMLGAREKTKPATNQGSLF
jgi:DNA ligase (NAD+)